MGQILDALNVGKADLVTHDIGNMVGYAFAAQYPDRVKRWVVMDAPLPGLGHCDEIISQSGALAFQFSWTCFAAADPRRP